MLSLDELVINSVQEKPALWNQEYAKKFPAQTWELWERVCKEVGFPVTKRNVIKSVWLGLRKKFMAARTKALKQKPSGGAANKTRKNQFIFYDQMMFLADTVDVPE